MKRSLAGMVISLMISAAGALAGQRPYEVGTVYIFLPSTSDEQIVHDLETIAATGINTIEICPSFLLTPGNPKPDFSKTDLILKTAERLGLRVMPTVFWSGLLPDYAESKWPDRFSPIIDGEGREARLSYADPEVMHLIDDYSVLTVATLQGFTLRDCLQHLGRTPHGGVLLIRRWNGEGEAAIPSLRPLVRAMGT